MNTDALFFRLANELPPVVEAAYTQWKSAYDSGTIGDAVQEVISKRKKEVQQISVTGSYSEKKVHTEDRDKDKVIANTEQKAGISCPVCGDVLVRYGVCSGCDMGKSGIKYTYKCSCGIELYTKGKL